MIAHKTKCKDDKQQFKKIKPCYISDEEACKGTWIVRWTTDLLAIIILNMILHLNEILNTVVSIGVNPFHYVLKLNLQNTGTYFIKRRDH